MCIVTDLILFLFHTHSFSEAEAVQSFQILLAEINTTRIHYFLRTATGLFAEMSYEFLS
jgi:hypothetical protein